TRTWRTRSLKHGARKSSSGLDFGCHCLFRRSRFPRFDLDTQSGGRVMVNPVVEQCWQVRAKLVKQLGGLDGLFDEMQRLDRKRLAAVASKKNAKRAT